MFLPESKGYNGDNTNHMTQGLRLHWLTNLVLGSDGVWDGTTLVTLQESVVMAL